MARKREQLGVGAVNIYGLFDRKMLEYVGGFLQAANDAVIMRHLRDTLPQGSLPGQHPEDFDLMYLGSFMTTTGVIHSEPPQLVKSLLEVLRGNAPTLEAMASEIPSSAGGN